MKEELIMLKKYRNILSKQQYKTFKGQILYGDTDGFKRGLITVLERNKNERIHNRKTNRASDQNRHRR